MSEPGTGIQGGQGSPIRHDWATGNPKAVKIDMNAPALTATGYGADDYPEGTRVVPDDDMTAWVVLDAARVTSGKQNASKVRVLKHRVEGFSVRQQIALAYVDGIFPDEGRLFNNGSLSTAQFNLFNQRLIVLENDEE